MRIELPWPPSVNHLYATVRGRRVLMKRGRDYHKEVAMLARVNGELLTGRLCVTFTAFPPDRRRRDLSNIIKIMEDSLTNAGVWGDDSQIDDLRIVRGPVEKPGRVEVLITEIEATL